MYSQYMGGLKWKLCYKKSRVLASARMPPLVIMCFFRFPTTPNDLRHWTQAYVISLLWVTMCLFRSPDWPNDHSLAFWTNVNFVFTFSDGMTRHITLLWLGKLSTVGFVKLGKVCHCFIEIADGRYFRFFDKCLQVTEGREGIYKMLFENGAPFQHCTKHKWQGKIHLIDFKVVQNMPPAPWKQWMMIHHKPMDHWSRIGTGCWSDWWFFEVLDLGL